jgi:DNA-binding PadR family transcriptional regulator
MDPEPFLNLDSVVHAPVRLAVLSILISVENAQFTFLKESTGTTDGNLHTHLAKLEGHGLLTVRKTFARNKPQTLYSITEKGRNAFAAYLEQLERIVRAGNKPEEKTGGAKPPKSAGTTATDFSNDDLLID